MQISEFDDITNILSPNNNKSKYYIYLIFSHVKLDFEQEEIYYFCNIVFYFISKKKKLLRHLQNDLTIIIWYLIRK